MKNKQQLGQKRRPEKIALIAHPQEINNTAGWEGGNTENGLRKKEKTVLEGSERIFD
jgi:hypothetical protein